MGYRCLVFSDDRIITTESYRVVTKLRAQIKRTILLV